jgi:multimeric flavodoxin WrbA
LIIVKIGILSGNPKTDGLCQAIVAAVRQGIAGGGAECDEIRLCDYEMNRCRDCDEGWGACRSGHFCTFGADGFDEARGRIRLCDALVIISPVYWGETTEVLKTFLDRLRRCEFHPGGMLRDKQVLLIASPGGSGNGLLSCLEQMDRFCRHTGAQIFDYIGVNRWNSDYKRLAARSAARALAAGRKNGDTVSLKEGQS